MKKTLLATNFDREEICMDWIVSTPKDLIKDELRSSRSWRNEARKNRIAETTEQAVVEVSLAEPDGDKCERLMS
jgi:hypothetical protein